MDGGTLTLGRHVFDSNGAEIIFETIVSTYEPRGPISVVKPDY
jgi:hypothetical protein